MCCCCRWFEQMKDREKKKLRRNLLSCLAFQHIIIDSNSIDYANIMKFSFGRSLARTHIHCSQIQFSKRKHSISEPITTSHDFILIFHSILFYSISLEITWKYTHHFLNTEMCFFFNFIMCGFVCAHSLKIDVNTMYCMYFEADNVCIRQSERFFFCVHKERKRERET